MIVWQCIWWNIIRKLQYSNNWTICLVTGCNWLPSREGAGGVLKPVNKTSLVTGLFAVCFSWRISKGSISLNFSPISYSFLSRRNVAEAKREKQLVNRQLKQTANEPVIVKWLWLWWLYRREYDTPPSPSQEGSQLQPVAINKHSFLINYESG